MPDPNSRDWATAGQVGWWSAPVSRSDGAILQAFVLDLRPPAEHRTGWATTLHYYGGVCMTNANDNQRVSLVPDPQPSVAEAAAAMARLRVLAPDGQDA